MPPFMKHQTRRGNKNFKVHINTKCDKNTLITSINKNIAEKTESVDVYGSHFIIYTFILGDI